MQTTLSLDDEALSIAQQFAAERAFSLDKAVSELVRPGASAPPKTRRLNGLTVFDLPSDSPIITSEHVAEMEENY